MTSPLDRIGDLQPAFSPDGEVLAFVRLHGVVESEIFLLTLDGAEPRLVTKNEGWITDLDWTADVESLVFVAASEAQAGTSLWKVSVRESAPERLAFGELAHALSIARSKARMVYDWRSWFDADLFRVDGPAATERGAPTRLISSSRLDWSQDYSPDGTRVAFASERSGSNNIWACQSDGTGCRQLTDMARAIAPCWSPDGRRIAFVGQEGNAAAQIYVIDVEGGLTRRLTRTLSRTRTPSWSRDGKWIYFGADSDGRWQIWKTSADGGEPRQLTRDGGTRPLESADGRYLYYVDAPAGPGSLRRVPVEGGAESVVAGLTVSSNRWTLWQDKVVYAVDESDSTNGHIDVFDLDTGEVSRILSTDRGIAAGMTVSPDGRWILLSMGDPPTSDLMLVEGFR